MPEIRKENAGRGGGRRSLGRRLRYVIGEWIGRGGILPVREVRERYLLTDHEWGLRGTVNILWNLQGPIPLVEEIARCGVPPREPSDSTLVRIGAALILCDADPQVGRRPAEGRIRYLTCARRSIPGGEFRIPNTPLLRGYVHRRLTAMRRHLHSGIPPEVPARCPQCVEYPCCHGMLSDQKAAAPIVPAGAGPGRAATLAVWHRPGRVVVGVEDLTSFAACPWRWWFGPGPPSAGSVGRGAGGSHPWRAGGSPAPAAAAWLLGAGLCLLLALALGLWGR